ncbi:M6 family metalloprotease domain-containing protein [Sedimenticola sp.]|uniref:M6 family metalloprotease domain-containing protein n=1 Tax=Sedimenticola sp. TaxID=1940285 RepID=UPI003D0DF08D
MFVRVFFGFIAVAVLLSGTAPVLGAPHRSGLKAEPVADQVSGRAAAAKDTGFSIQGLADHIWPKTISLFMLRVQFQEETAGNDDPLTTGNGRWDDPQYAHDGDADFWITKNAGSGTGSTDGDISRYYREVSNQQLTVEVTVSTSLYTLSKTMGQYADTASGLNELIGEAKTLAAAETPSSYDALMIVHAGVGEETDIAGDTPGDIWSAYLSGANEAVVVPQTGTQDCGSGAPSFAGPCPAGNAGIDDFATVDSLGVMVHEFGHWLGLPDLYNTSTGGEAIGDWSLMATGIYNRSPTSFYGGSPSHPIAWSKKLLGWISPVSVSPGADPGAMSLLPVDELDVGSNPVDPVTAGSRVLKVQSSASQAAYYFLLEHRTRQGFDSGLPGEGLLVWSIDAAVAENSLTLTANQVNAQSLRPGVKLIEADGDGGLTNSFDSDFGSPGDPFPGTTGNIQLTPVTSPSSQPFVSDGWINMKGIAENSATGSVDFDLGFGPGKVVLSGVAHTCSGSSISWSSVSASDLDTYRVYRDGQFLTETVATSYQDSGGTGNNLYQVSAVDVLGNEGSKSNGLIANSNSCGSQGGGGGGTIGYFPLLILLFLTRRARESRALPDMR